MSAALQLPVVWGASNPQAGWQEDAEDMGRETGYRPEVKPPAKTPEAGPVTSLAFYRKHTENMLRRYLYASMQVGRTPSILGDPVGAGMVLQPADSHL